MVTELKLCTVLFNNVQTLNFNQCIHCLVLSIIIEEVLEDKFRSVVLCTVIGGFCSML